MKKLLLLLLYTTITLAQGPKILHLSFHRGCINDFQTVAHELSLDVTSWYILAADRPRTHFDGITTGNAVYNITHERAQRVWDLHKDYFNQFDIILTSDTAPLSRIFLQNNWQKPLIIWICNRFDYADWSTAHGQFPDQEYYDLFAQATRKPNVKIIGYTQYEHYYARARGINTGWLTITPVGSCNSRPDSNQSASIPETVEKSSTVFLYPRLTEKQQAYAEQQCAMVGIKTYCGSYSYPQELVDFKGVLYFPYAWSNLAVFENMLLGIVTFMPSPQFVIENIRAGNPIRYCTTKYFELVEWYSPAHAPYIVYFDSWTDLQQKVATLDYQAARTSIKQHALEHRQTMLDRWRTIFQTFDNATVRNSSNNFSLLM